MVIPNNHQGGYMPTLTHRCRQVQSEPTYLGSMLPSSKKWLQGDSKRWEVLKCAKGREEEEGVEEWRSVMDMIFCWVFPYFKDDVIRFYEGRGGKLVDLYSLRTIQEMDRHLVRVLKETLRSIEEARQDHEAWCRFLASQKSL